MSDSKQAAQVQQLLTIDQQEPPAMKDQQLSAAQSLSNSSLSTLAYSPIVAITTAHSNPVIGTTVQTHCVAAATSERADDNSCVLKRNDTVGCGRTTALEVDYSNIIIDTTYIHHSPTTEHTIAGLLHYGQQKIVEHGDEVRRSRTHQLDTSFFFCWTCN